VDENTLHHPDFTLAARDAQPAVSGFRLRLCDVVDGFACTLFYLPFSSVAYLLRSFWFRLF
jgi:hypothetical protein